MPKTGPGRPSPMDDPEQQATIADMFGKGASRAEIAKVVGVHRDTVTKWIRRPDMQALITAVRAERANRVIRTVDAAIMAHLETEEARAKLSLKELLDIRKTFQPTTIEVGRVGDTDAAALAVWDMADRNLELVEGEIVDEDD